MDWRPRMTAAVHMARAEIARKCEERRVHDLLHFRPARRLGFDPTPEELIERRARAGRAVRRPRYLKVWMCGALSLVGHINTSSDVERSQEVRDCVSLFLTFTCVCIPPRPPFVERHGTGILPTVFTNQAGGGSEDESSSSSSEGGEGDEGGEDDEGGGGKLAPFWGTRVFVALKKPLFYEVRLDRRPAYRRWRV